MQILLAFRENPALLFARSVIIHGKMEYKNCLLGQISQSNLKTLIEQVATATIYMVIGSRAKTFKESHKFALVFFLL